MKILCVAQYYPPHIGGLEAVAERQAMALASAGHEVTVATTTPDAVASAGVGIRHIAAWHVMDRRWGIPFAFAGVRACRRIYADVSRADLVVVHDILYMTSWYACLAAALRGARVILVQHVGIVEHPRALVRLAQRAVYATIGALMYAYSERVVCYNPIVRAFVRARGVRDDAIVLLGNGVDMMRFAPADAKAKAAARTRCGLPQDRVIVLCAGRFVPKKGFAEAFEARDDCYDLVFAGSGEVPREWQEDARVHVLGAVPRERMPDVYRAADIFLSPTRREYFTLAMQEACAAGLAVVASDEPEYPAGGSERDAITFVEPSGPCIKEALRFLVRTPDARARMGALSRALAHERFDAAAHDAAFVAVCEKKPRVVVTTSWDDGHVLDLRLALALREYGIKATFYVAPYDHEFGPPERLTEAQIAELAKDFEIGAHTLTHPHLTRISDERARKEMEESKRLLERVVGSPVRSFCYPAGYFAPRHKAMLSELGFTYARTVARYATEPGADRFAMPTTFHAYRHWSDIWPMMRCLGLRRFARGYFSWDRAAIALFDDMTRRGGVFHLWGHSWEIDRNRDWARLERVLSHIGNRADVHYVTNSEVMS